MNSSGKGLIIFDFIVTRRKLLYQDENAQLRMCCSVSRGKSTVTGNTWLPIGTGILSEKN